MNERAGRPERFNLLTVSAIGALIGGPGFVAYQLASGAFASMSALFAAAGLLGMLIAGAALGGVLFGLLWQSFMALSGRRPGGT